MIPLVTKLKVKTNHQEQINDYSTTNIFNSIRKVLYAAKQPEVYLQDSLFLTLWEMIYY